MAFALLIAASVTPYLAAMPISVSPFTTTWTCADPAGLGIGALVAVGVGAGVGAGVAAGVAPGDRVAGVAGAGATEATGRAPDGSALAIVETPALSLRMTSPIEGLARRITEAMAATAMTTTTARRHRLRRRGADAPGPGATPDRPAAAAAWYRGQSGYAAARQNALWWLRSMGRTPSLARQRWPTLGKENRLFGSSGSPNNGQQGDSITRRPAGAAGGSRSAIGTIVWMPHVPEDPAEASKHGAATARHHLCECGMHRMHRAARGAGMHHIWMIERTSRERQPVQSGT